MSERHTWIGDDGTGNKLIEHDIPDSQFEEFLPKRRHPWLWDASTQGRGLDGVGRPNWLDHLINAYRDVVVGVIATLAGLGVTVLIVAAVFTCVILPILHHH